MLYGNNFTISLFSWTLKRYIFHRHFAFLLKEKSTDHYNNVFTAWNSPFTDFSFPNDRSKQNQNPEKIPLCKKQHKRDSPTVATVHPLTILFRDKRKPPILKKTGQRSNDLFHEFVRSVFSWKRDQDHWHMFFDR